MHRIAICLAALAVSNDDGLAKVRVEQPDEDYRPMPSADGRLAAPNSAQGWWVEYHDHGIVVTPRLRVLSSGERTPFEFGLRVASLTRGSGDSPRVIEVVEPKTVGTGSKVEYAREGLTEWWESRPDGIEHSFRIEHAPAGSGALLVELSVTGSLVPRGAEGIVDFVAPDGTVEVRYDHLAVFAADGESLPATMYSRDGSVRIEIDADESDYPIFVDPLATSPDWQVTGTGSNQGFGGSVAGAGDVDGDGYDDVIVGASQYSSGETEEGAAFVYLGSVSGLSTVPAWSTESNQADAYYGQSVASAGDVNGDGYDDVLVGALFFDGAASNGGRAYLYLGSPAGLSPTPAWIVDGPNPEEFFGSAVAGAGDVNGDGFPDVILGAPNFEFGGTSLVGRAELYLGSATGLASTPSWNATGNGLGLFGFAVAGVGDLDGDGFADVAVGAHAASIDQSSDGSVSLFPGSATGPSIAPSFVADGATADDWFGYSVAGAGDVDGDGLDDLLVGSSLYGNGEVNEGAAFLYRGQSGGAVPVLSWTVEGGQTGAAFGSVVASGGDVNGDGFSDVVVGALSFDLGALTNTGRAAFYVGSPQGPSISPTWTKLGTYKSENFARSLGTAGDVDGDGFADLVIGSPNYQPGLVGGRAVLFLGACDGITSTVVYGSGKAGSPGVPTLTSLAPPKIGSTSDLTIAGGLPGAPAYLLAGASQIAQPFDGGTLLVSPQFVLPLGSLDPSGAASLPVAIPGLPSLCGFSYSFQAFVVDPGASGAYHTAQTPGLEWILGS